MYALLSSGSENTYTSLTGLRPQMGLPTIKPKLLEWQQRSMADALKQYRAKVAAKKEHNSQNLQVGGTGAGI